jgi:hypothetical protein
MHQFVINGSHVLTCSTCGVHPGMLWHAREGQRRLWQENREGFGMLWLTLARFGRETEKALTGQRRLWHTLADFGALWQGNREGFDRPEKALTCYGMKTKKALARLYETPARCGFVYPLPVHPIPFHSGRVFGVIRTRLRSGPGTFGSMKWLW